MVGALSICRPVLALKYVEGVAQCDLLGCIRRPSPTDSLPSLGYRSKAGVGLLSASEDRISD
jgi:hypothetical protein